RFVQMPTLPGVRGNSEDQHRQDPEIQAARDRESDLARVLRPGAGHRLMVATTSRLARPRPKSRRSCGKSQERPDALLVLDAVTLPSVETARVHHAARRCSGLAIIRSRTTDWTSANHWGFGRGYGRCMGAVDRCF